jgi:hypothetical protein
MKTLLARKQTDEQRTLNDLARYQFIMAMMNVDESMLIPYLKDNGSFLGYMNKWQLMNYLRMQFNRIQPFLFQSRLREGISLDIYAGSDTFEVSYAPVTNIDMTSYDENQDYEMFFNNSKSFKILLVVIFENGKITDIRMPKKIAYKKQVSRFQIEN